MGHIPDASSSALAISLTYLSTATFPFSRDTLQSLLSHSRQRNQAADLSGMLLYADGHFIQTIEGAEQAVDETYSRITRDTRHRDIIVALREPISERRFGSWSMGFDQLDETRAMRMPGFNDFLAARTEADRTAQHLGRAGVFHRVFRDRMR